MSACTTLTEAFSGSQMIPVITTQNNTTAVYYNKNLKHSS